LTHALSRGESAAFAAPGGQSKEERVLLDVRTYKTLPGRVPAQLEIYKKYGYPVQLRYMGEPLCYAVAESGELNTFTHIWVYASAADREEKRARMAKDPDWAVYLAENVKGGHLISQETRLMTPASFAPPIPMPKIIP
jgi:NIPSNAP